MRYSQAFIPTLKQAPREATAPSHVLLLRAGFARQVGAGLYTMLPLGMRVQQKIAQIVREEMDRAGAQEVLMPALLPADYYKESGRWDSMGEVLLRLQDRKGGDYHLGPTHEELFTHIFRNDVRSYRELPLNLYQIQMKYRDEPRPRAGLLRCREFLMKDAYSFDVSEQAAEQSYGRMRDAYHRVFQRLGLDYRIVAADSGAMGGSMSAEFQVLAQHGEDDIVACSDCEYAANVEVAQAARKAQPAGSAAAASEALERVHTPGKTKIEDVAQFLGEGVEPRTMLKSLVYQVGKDLVLAVVRGDHELNPVKLARAAGVAEVEMATEEQVRTATGAKVGFAGPVGFKGLAVFIDPDAAALSDAVTGANETDYHLRHVVFERDFQATVADLRLVQQDDPCPQCAKPLNRYRGIEGGHIFLLGKRYSEPMGAQVSDEQGETRTVVMGSYGIGISRLIAAAVEQFHDDNGIVWPVAIAPYQTIITSIGDSADVMTTSERLYSQLTDAGLEVLWDERPGRPGVKFKDADLLGIPVRVTVGERGLKDGVVEIKPRRAAEPQRVPVETCLEAVQAMLRPSA